MNLFLAPEHYVIYLKEVMVILTSRNEQYLLAWLVVLFRTTNLIGRLIW